MLKGAPSYHASRVGRMIVEAAVLVIVSVSIGLLVNHFSPRGIPLLARAEEETTGQMYTIDLDEAKKKYDSGEALFIDARGEEDYGAGHIKGALSLPAHEIESRLAGLFDLLIDDRQVITYCGGEECHSSTDLADSLRAAGCLNVRVFHSGWVSWKASGYPVEVGLEQPLGQVDCDRGEAWG